MGKISQIAEDKDRGRKQVKECNSDGKQITEKQHRTMWTFQEKKRERERERPKGSENKYKIYCISLTPNYH